jgi:hypothetical protein
MDHVLVILALAAFWVLFVCLSPTRECRSCGRHRGPCPRCKGTGRRFRLGARLAGKALLALRKAWEERP